MAYSVRTKCYVDSSDTARGNDYIKQIYVKNKTWNPPPAPTIIEDKLIIFEKQLKYKQQQLESKLKRINLRNLSTPLMATLRSLKNNENFIIKPSDKNLGPAIMDKSTYIKQVLKGHLLTQSYKCLSDNQAKNIMDHIKGTLKTANLQHLSNKELTYFQRSLNTFHRLPIFYGLPKVHKKHLLHSGW
jgi:hypothetical protein